MPGRFHFIAGFLFALLLLKADFMVIASSNKQKASKTIPCDATLWKHVWKPERLKIISDCITVSGKVKEIRAESDGDLHLLLKPDKDYLYLLSAQNAKDAEGCLVVELVCVGKVKDKEAQQVCLGYRNKIHLPETGEHVKVTGSLVTDLHHGWNEIHPVTNIKRLK